MSFLAAFIYRQFLHYPPVPTVSFEGKTVIVTGANVGLGKEACRWIVRFGASKVILACRNIDKGVAAVEDIQQSTACASDILEVWHLDLSSYKSVIAFGERAKSQLTRLDAVVENAGLGTTKFRTTEDNEEIITTNVVSLFLHAFLLYPKLQETAEQFQTETYLTITSSELYEVAKFKEKSAPAGKLFATLNNKETANMRDRYNVSKLMEVLIVKQLAQLAPWTSSKVIVNCVAPGLCDTELHREHEGAMVRFAKWVFCRPAEVGSRTLVYGASCGAASHGQYIPDCKITPTKGLTSGKVGRELQERVWRELVEKLEGIKPGISIVLSSPRAST